MTIAKNILTELRAQNIKLALQGENLEIISFDNKLSQEVVAQIRSHKSELLEYLKAIEQKSSSITYSIEKVEPASSYALSSSQFRLWVLGQFEEASVAYNIPSQVTLQGDYNIGHLQKAIDAVIERHEILRTVFRENESGEVRQWIRTSQELGFQSKVIDLSEEVSPEAAASTFIQEDSFAPFDLANGPLLRAAFLRTAPDTVVFYYNMHHIVSDGWSMEVLTTDIMACYNSFSKAMEPVLPELKLQYKDYAARQLQEADSEHYKVHKNFWAESFKGELPLLDLPGAGQRPKVKTYAGRGLQTFITAEDSNKLRSYCNENGGTLFMGLLSIWNVLCQRYTGQADFITGTPVTGREHPDLDEQIGFYVNTLALRVQMSEKESFDSVFRKVKESTLLAFSHQMYPFDRLVEDLKLVKDTSRNAVFDALLTVQNVGQELTDFSLPAEEVNHFIDHGESISKFDIDLTFKEMGEFISFDLNFNTEVYNEHVIKRLMRHFKQLLNALVSNTSTDISALEYLEVQERKTLQNKLDFTAINYPKDKTILSYFDEQVQTVPENIAVAFESTELSYKDLDEVSNQLATYLNNQHHVKLEDLVGVKLERSEWIIISLLAVLKAGAAYVPIDPAYPQDRIAYIENDSQCKVCIDQTELDKFIEVQDTISKELQPTEILPENLAYVIYTSGTSGQPKGVLLEHKNVVRLFFNEKPLFDFSASDVWTLFHSFCFDFSVWEMYGALLFGGKVVVVSKEVARDTQAFATLAAEQGVTVLNQTPTSFNGFQREALEADLDLKLRYVIFGGEALNPKALVNWNKQYPACKLINMYGITETTVHVTYREVTQEMMETGASDIGEPIPTLSCLLLDQNMQLVPTGVAAEIYVGGAGVARGYLNRSDLTAERFISSPFDAEQRLYRTGDLGRVLPNGGIEYLGRKDDQVKIRGHRIELAEIEQTLLKHEAILATTVLASTDEGNESVLVAYVVADDKQNIADLRAFLQKSLPEYMLPSYFIQIPEIPRTVNGKIDKKSLPSAIAQVMDSGVEYVAPSSLEEKLLVAVWEEVLGRSEIGIRDNFYNLGGDSIKSIQVVSRIKQRGYALKVEHILRTPVLEELASHVVENKRITDQAEVTGKVELTPIQAYFFNDASFGARDHYTQSVLLKSKAELDHESIKKSIAHLVQHHDALRMVYRTVNEQTEQHNEAVNEARFDLQFHDLAEAENPVEALGKLGEAMQSGFDLEHGPLARIAHFKMKDGDRLALVMHHLVVDGFSWRIVLEDLTTLYGQYSSALKAQLPLKTDSFQQWATAQKEYAQSSAIEGERTYWESVSSQEVSALPRDKDADKKQFELDATVSFTLSSSMTELLQTKVHQAYNTEINDVLLTGLSRALNATFGVEKSVLKVEGHGREDIVEDIDMSRTVGWFTTMYPFVLEAGEASNPSESLVRIKEALRSIPNKGIGYGILNRWSTGFQSKLKPEIVFNYLGDFGSNVGNQEDVILEYSGEYIGENSSNQNKSDVLLDVSGMLVSDQLTMSISYPTEVYDADSITRLTEAFETQLTGLIEALANTKETRVTPSDLTYKNLTFEELERINANCTVEDVYKLSPLQAGIFYHWLKETSSELYFEQVSYHLKAPKLEIDLVQQAYNKLVERHPILRTSFTNDLSDVPLQIVRKNVAGNFDYEAVDLPDDQAKRYEYIGKVQAEDIRKGFDLSAPSQMRLKVIDFGKGEFEFIWSHQHVLMDGWCMSILISEFYQLLNAAHQKVEVELPTPAPYSSYIDWLEQVDTDVSKKYWNSCLSEYAEVAEVPFQKTPSHDEAYEGVIEGLFIEGELFDQMKAMCKRLGITQNTFIQSIWGYLLARYNNRQDVVFGAVVSGRPGDLHGVEEMVGLFINTIPVRVHYESQHTPAELLANMQQNAVEGNAHHYLSLADVQAESELGMNLLSHYMVFENFPIQEAIKEEIGTSKENSGLEMEIASLNSFQRNHYDFSIVMMPDADAVSVDFRYNGEVFEKGYISRIVQHFKHLVKQFVMFENTPLNQLGLFDKEEEKSLLTDFNSSEVSYAADQTFIDLFETQVQQSPSNVAVVFENTTLTYQELNAQANQLAHYLQETHTVQPNDFVAIKLDKSEQMIVAILGVLKSGAAYVPVDTLFPEERIKYMLTNAGCKTLVDQKMLDALPDAGMEQPNIQRVASPEDVAYMIYTSGSTGDPKGVLVQHSSLMDYIHGILATTAISTCQSFGLLTTIAADLGSTSIYPALSTGKQLHIFNDEELRTPELASKIDVDCIKVVPSHWQSLQDENSTFLPKRCIIFGGEELTSTIVAMVNDRGFDGVMYNHYGPTETTIGKLICEIDFKAEQPEIRLGKPFGNNKVYILDSQLKLSPIGVVGQICISGNGVAKGYHNNAEATADKFVSNPFWSEQRLYKTGDLGRILPDGSIQFFGRMDNQVKIRGYRVETGEVEQVLLRNNHLNEAIVLPLENNDGERELVAYVTATAKQNSSDLRAFLSPILPEYMIPTHFVQLEEFPRTLNGKLDKKALPHPDVAELGSGTTFAEPRNAVERRLVELWEDVLQVENIGIKDDFFALGGQSIKAIKVIMKIQKEFKVALNIQKLFQNPTIEMISETIGDVATSEIDESKVKKTIEL
jgi:amino acid adenylation domain-containing protein/non-ribosomal peptide synthase protein (TIGR01720 family)